MSLDQGDSRLIIQKCQKYGLLRNQTAYVLGTVNWETGSRMEPVRETFAEHDKDVEPRLESAWKRGRLPWVSKPYWRTGYWGRGYVQLTHETNYARAGRELGIDLVSEPHRALEPEISAEILVRGMRDGWFTGKQLSDYITLQESNYRGARRIVNGTDKASVVAELARDYEADLTAEGYGSEKPAPVVNERRDGTEPRTSRLQSKTVMSQVQQWAGALPVGGFAWFQAEDPYIKAAILAGVFLVILSGAIIMRERIAKWANGVR